MRADRESYYQPSWAAALLSLAFAILLLWQGGARAGEYIPPDTAQFPDAVNGPGADRVPPGLACTDNMDFTPDTNMPSPFDGDRVAWRPSSGLRHPVVSQESCDTKTRSVTV